MTRLSFYCEKMDFFEKVWSYQLFFFKKRKRKKPKQNKKENPKCDFLFGKDMSLKTEFRFEGQVTHRKSTIG